MKYVIIQLFLILVTISLLSQNSNIQGIKNDPTINSNFNKGHESIKAAIVDSISNLNLYEYSHSLKELYELMSEGNVANCEWSNYINSLLLDVIDSKNDTIKPIFATDYKGIIPLQAECFLASLEVNTLLNEQYPNEYLILRDSTRKLLGLGYSWADIDSLLVCFPQSSMVGTVNFWYLLQLYGCSIIELGIKKEGAKIIKMKLANLDKISTYKTPLYLQLRKFKTIKNNTKVCLDENDFVLKGSTMVKDDDREYHKRSIIEGIDIDKIKEF